MAKKRKESPNANGERRRKKSKTTNTNKPPPKTFFDLPAEIRNEIYDMTSSPSTKEQKGSSYPLSGLISRQGTRAISHQPVPAIARTCRKMRQEFLPIYHRHQNLTLDWNFTCNAEVTEKWLDIFGETRVPLTRRFVLGIVPRLFRSVAIDLEGGLKVSLRCELPRGEGKSEYREKVKGFVESRLQEGEAGRYLTVEGVRAVVAFAGGVGREG